MTELNEVVVDKVIREAHSESSDNSKREELLWESREEELINKWKADCHDKSKCHNVKGKKFKKLHALFSVPAMLVPIMTGSFQPYMNGLTMTSLMFLSGILSGVTTFFSFAKKQEQHLLYENLYGKLANEISSEMIKPRRNRIAADVYIQKILSEYNELGGSAPLL